MKSLVYNHLGRFESRSHVPALFNDVGALSRFFFFLLQWFAEARFLWFVGSLWDIRLQQALQRYWSSLLFFWSEYICTLFLQGSGAQPVNKWYSEEVEDWKSDLKKASICRNATSPFEWGNAPRAPPPYSISLGKSQNWWIVLFLFSTSTLLYRKQILITKICEKELLIWFLSKQSFRLKVINIKWLLFASGIFDNHSIASSLHR